jgi:hypothetical protein
LVLLAPICPTCAAAGPAGAVGIALSRVSRLQSEIGRLVELVDLLVVRWGISDWNRRMGATHEGGTDGIEDSRTGRG